MAIMEQPALVIFGPQISWPSNSSAERIRRDLVQEPSLAPFADAIRKIPELWASLVEIEPRLRETQGRRNLEQLRDWVEIGSLPRRDSPDEILPNGFATPFTVIAQSIEYWRCFPRGGLQWLHSRSEAGPALEGMCTGFLTAIAAATSKDSTEFFTMAAIAVRLAACIGTFVDLNGNTSDGTGEARALVVRWSSPIQESCLLRILEEQPNVSSTILPSALSQGFFHHRKTGIMRMEEGGRGSSLRGVFGLSQSSILIKKELLPHSVLSFTLRLILSMPRVRENVITNSI